jgi:hypothetical protein
MKYKGKINDDIIGNVLVFQDRNNPIGITPHHSYLCLHQSVNIRKTYTNDKVRKNP